LSDRIRGRADFERVSGTTVLATVPAYRRRRRDGESPVILRAPESPAAESFRYLRSRLQPHLRGASTILVASAGGREGRTTTAANLAVAMAQAGLNVVLIDADMRHPRLHEVFGVENAVGLTSVLAAPGTLQQAVRETSVPRLRLLAGGPPTGNAGDLLVQSRLGPVLDAVAASCDLVILDSGAVLSVSDPIALAAFCDHVLLVGDCRRTTRRYVARALAELAEVVHGNVSGVLLNTPRMTGAPHGRPEHAVVSGTAAAGPGAAPASVGPASVGPASVGPAAVGSAAVPQTPTVYGSASVPVPAIPGHAGESGHPAGADLPHAADRRRRLTRRG
jgi:capsular exopolysaccharide synthesis family protein